MEASSAGSRAPELPATDPRAIFARQSPLVKWMTAGIITVLVLWIAIPSASTPAGGANPNSTGAVASVDAVPMSREQALAILTITREDAMVETQAEEVFVSFTAARFPLQPAGQLALVQRYARADEVVEGRRRRIFFHGPNGSLFAQSDAVTGITLKR